MRACPRFESATHARLRRGRALVLHLLVAFLLAFSPHASAAQFAFAALGDTPYNRDEEPQLVAMIGEMNRQPLAFALHVGDIKDSRTACSDELYRQRRAVFALSHHPFFYTPGDNEWTDCDRTAWGRREPLERLGKLRQLFFTQDASLGQRTLRAERQTAKGYPENMRWSVENMLFATLNVPGPDNNRKHMPDESKRRTAALLEWMRETFNIARERKLPALALAMQADMWIGNSAYAEILAVLADEARRFEGEVLLIHGDTHWFRFDRPLVDPRSGQKVENVTRLEVYGSPFVNWIYVTVNTDGARAQFSAIPGSRLLNSQKP
jgi:hypothetical protein